MAVSASTPGTNPGWLVFALSNPTSERIVRWLVAPRYTLANSRVFWPTSMRRASPPSRPRSASGPRPLKSDRADMFRLNLEPGQTVTFAAEIELAAGAAPQSVGPERLPGQAAGPHVVQRRAARHHRPARHLPHRDLRRQSPRHLPGHRARRLGGAGLFLRRFRLLEQDVPGGPRPHRALSRGGRSGARREPRAVPLHLPPHRALARLDQDLVLGLDRRPIRADLRRHRRSAPLPPGWRAPRWSPSPASAPG